MDEMQSYIQMGYTDAQYRQAKEMSERRYMDILDALQYIQKKENQKKLGKAIPTNSFLKPMENFTLSQYQSIHKVEAKENRQISNELREPNLPVGLLNVSNSCYLNSLIQCYFLMGSFTRQILQAELTQLPTDLKEAQKKKIKNEYSLLEAMRTTFAKMRLGIRKYLDPTCVLKKLINSLGQKIQYGDEKDLYQIHMQIIQRLSECLTYSKKCYSKNSTDQSKIRKQQNKQNVKHFFYGLKIQYTQGSNTSGQIVDFMVLMLNPKHKILQCALDAEFNYDVQINGNTIKKHSYIRMLPTYLFITINRTQYKVQQNQVQKNTQKIQFDFQIFMDKYLQINKQSTKEKGKFANKLIQKRNNIKYQLIVCDQLIQKLTQCRPLAEQIGFEKILPLNQQVQKKKNSLQSELKNLQKELSKIQSKKEGYVLFFIFVHRGDGVSGHYWGYGKNGKKWYKFDQASTIIQQKDILIDIQRFQGTAYGLVYAKDALLESFDYRHFYSLDQLQSSSTTSSDQKPDYSKCIPTKLKKLIINENTYLRQSLQKQKHRAAVKTIVKDYVDKYNFVKVETQRHLIKQKVIHLPHYLNFACYLQTIGQHEAMKAHIFEMALQEKGPINYTQLLANESFFKLMQEAFKKKVKAQMRFKNFPFEKNSFSDPNYKQIVQQYIIGKKCFEFLGFLSKNLRDLPKIPKIQIYLDDITQVLRTKYDNIYIKNLTEQIVIIMLLERAKMGLPVKKKWIDGYETQYPFLLKQLIELKCPIANDQPSKERSSIAVITLQKNWIKQSTFKKIANNFMQSIKNILQQNSFGYNIYQINMKKKITQNPVQEKDKRVNRVSAGELAR